jgi:hypothetical protein
MWPQHSRTWGSGTQARPLVLRQLLGQIPQPEMTMNTQPEALLKAVTQAFGPDGEATSFDAKTWASIHAAIIHTIALNAELLNALKVLVENGGIGPEDMFDDARATIAKATGEPHARNR